MTISLFTNDDLYLFNEGNHSRLYEKLGAHLMRDGSVEGIHFSVWAPDAAEINVMGDFNHWHKQSHRLVPKAQSGIWEGFIPGLGKGVRYKYHIRSRYNGYSADKADPFAFFSEVPPLTASIVLDLDYVWGDRDWMQTRKGRNAFDGPMAIYEVHLGSWMRKMEEGGRSLTYRELAHDLTRYVRDTGFTHVEFLPVMEHPFYGSWGYQTLGYFCPSSRFGSPQDFMALVDSLHQGGIGVILDWVPSHFPSDEYGLGFFDGTHLFEHEDPRKGIHPDWNSLIFNYGRNEVRSFLISSALFWLDKYHVDGLRVDAVASMLYLDYGHKDGDWVPNVHGGKENLEAIGFLRRLNQEIYINYPDVQTMAEESTSWPMVSKPAYVGGLGFGMKWDMGWMHDTLAYMSRDPVHRKFHHDKLTFRMLYSFQENFVLPLSHDEVVYGKGSLLRKMPGDDWQKFANLRLLLGYMYAQSGKKLLFMGGEFGQWNEWYHEAGLDWNLLEYPLHKGMSQWVTDLNWTYRNERALHQRDFDQGGFHWIDCNDSDQSTLSLIRLGHSSEDLILAVFNFTPVPRDPYRVGAPRSGFWRELLNSDSDFYGGSGMGNMGGIESQSHPHHGQAFSLQMTLPPLAAVFLKWEGKVDEKRCEA